MAYTCLALVTAAKQKVMIAHRTSIAGIQMDGLILVMIIWDGIMPIVYPIVQNVEK